MVYHMRAYVGKFCVVCVLLLCGACDKSAPAPSGANLNGGVNSAAASSATNGAANADASANRQELDAEIARLEQVAEKNPDDDTTLSALADAYVRRGNALHDARRLTDALHDYQSAVRFSPDHEEANLRVAQITQEIGEEPHAEDGKPVSVPAKPGANENQ